MEENYYQTAESVEQYIKMAEGHSGKDLIKQLKIFLPAESTLLELGSGPGTDWQILNQDFDVTGSDFSPEFLKRLMLKHPDNEFLELDASTLNTSKNFDAIYSNKVLHQLTDEALKASITRQHEILNSDGLICHSFWKGEGTEVYNGLFVNNHNEAELQLLFGSLFDILLLEDYAEFEKGDSILVIARKK